MFVGGRGPMAILAFRFGTAPPSRQELNDQLREALGPLYACIDSIEVGKASATRSDQDAWVLSQDLVALTYAKKAWSDLGGARVDPKTKEPVDLLLPAWANVPWDRQGWAARLKIRFGRSQF